MIKKLTPELIAKLKRDFETADYSRSEGLTPAEIEAKVNERTENAPCGEPFIITRAYLLKLMTENFRIDFNPDTYFGEKFDLGADYSGQWVKDGFFTGFMWERRMRIRKERTPEKAAAGDKFWRLRIGNPSSDYGHACLDWVTVMRLGIKGLLDRSDAAEREKTAAAALTRDQADFYEAVRISYSAVFTYCRRLADLAEKRGATEAAADIRALTVRPPQTLSEAMHLSLIMLDLNELGIERIRSLGNLDVIYAPFYRADVESGRLTKEDAYELFRYFFLRIFAAKRAANQPFCIGGVADGKSLVSDMTFLMLDAYRSLGITNPKIHVRINKIDTSPLFETACDMILRGNGSVVLICDESVEKGYEKIGIPRSISQNYLPIGCYENVIVGYEDARICSSWINTVKAVEFAMNGGVDPLSGETYKAYPHKIGSYEDFISAVEFYFAEFYKDAKEAIVAEKQWNPEVNPNALYSSTLTDCAINGKDVFDGGMNVRNTSLKYFGIGTAVDAIEAVKKLVYEDKRFSLDELAVVMKNDWKGNEALRAEALHFEHKWGRGDEKADSLAARLYGFIARLVVGSDNDLGGVYRLGADSVDHSVIFASATGATPDGRYARQEISKNLRPTSGQEKCGVTGFLKSVTALDGSDFIDGAPADVVLHPSAVRGEKGRAAFIALAKNYFARGGNAFQGNIVDAETLEKAQADPASYADLQIRVCGWNEYFVNMSRAAQNDFIARAKENE